MDRNMLEIRFKYKTYKIIIIIIIIIIIMLILYFKPQSRF